MIVPAGSALHQQLAGVDEGGRGRLPDGTPAVVLQDTSDPDELSVPNRFVDTRSVFFDECSEGNYNFDTLRRAKHSTMMVLRRLPSGFFYGSALCFWGGCLAAACNIPNLSVLFDLSGVTIGPTIVFFTPAALLWQRHWGADDEQQGSPAALAAADARTVNTSRRPCAAVLILFLGLLTTACAFGGFIGEGILNIPAV